MSPRKPFTKLTARRPRQAYWSSSHAWTLGPSPKHGSLMLRAGWVVIRWTMRVSSPRSMGNGLGGDVDRDGPPGVDPAEANLLPGDHARICEPVVLGAGLAVAGFVFVRCPPVAQRR